MYCIVACFLAESCVVMWLCFCQWHSFAVPELENFLLMLEKEEDRHVVKVQDAECYSSSFI